MKNLWIVFLVFTILMSSSAFAKKEKTKAEKKSDTAVVVKEEKKSEEKPAGDVTKVCDSTKSFLRKSAAFTLVTTKKVWARTKDVGKWAWDGTIGKFHKKSPKPA